MSDRESSAIELTEQAGPDSVDHSSWRKPARVRISTYILKVASRCNLNCKYCYVYNMGDDSYREQPYRMSADVVSALLSRVATYCREENLEDVSFVFHGGEPLLTGRSFFREFVAKATAVLGELNIAPIYALETNATLITPEWLDLFGELGICFGISLDGPEAIHDANRVNHSGRGSYRQVRRSITTVLADQRMKKLFGGVLTVINLAANPLEIYHHYREIGLPRCDFLLPDGNYDHPPLGLLDDRSSTPYADWLITIFDEWFEKQDTALSIRIFEQIIRLLFSPGFGNDALGGDENGILVIETDGAIEPVDVLKICGPRLTKLGLNVQRNEIRDACEIGLMQLYQRGAAGLCDICRGCPAVAVCGGGYLPHRYSAITGFANPSVYCRDLMKLIIHIRTRVIATVPEETRRKLGMQSISYERALALLEPACRQVDSTRRSRAGTAGHPGSVNFRSLGAV